MLNWDYTNLSCFYEKRVDYSKTCVQILLDITKPSLICDIGAGTGKLTTMLAANRARVVAIEPNLEMMSVGFSKTNEMLVEWENYSAEDNKQASEKFDLVTFGSSLNVTDVSKSIPESIRILKPDGYLACLWNHRDFSDDLQKQIEQTIKANLNNYSYGSRREDQSLLLRKYLKNIIKVECDFEVVQKKQDSIDAWRSHLTLKKQSGDRFEHIISEISKLTPEIFSTRYTTVMWIGQK